MFSENVRTAISQLTHTEYEAAGPNTISSPPMTYVTSDIDGVAVGFWVAGPTVVESVLRMVMQ